MEERSGPHYNDNYIPVHQEPMSHKGMTINPPNPAFLKFFDSESKKRFEPGFKFAHHYVDERVPERNINMIEPDDRGKLTSVKSEQPYLEKNDMEQQMHYHRNEHSPNQEWMAKYYNKEPTSMHPFQMECTPPQPPPPPPPPPPPAPPREENCGGEGSPKLEIDYLEDSLNPQLPDFIPQGMNHKGDSLTDEDQVGNIDKPKLPLEEKKAAPSKPFLCSKCEYKTNFKSNLKSHELNHSGTYKFQCSKCEYKTNFKSNLKNHELNHSLTYKFQCADCEYKTNFKSNLKNHELSHSMTYRFQCEKCEYKTNFKNCMKNHELTHSGTKQFHCSQCEYKTNFKRCLKIHELRHANT